MLGHCLRCSVHCSKVHYTTVDCTVHYSTVHCSTVEYTRVHCAVQYSALYCTAQLNSLQNRVPCTMYCNTQCTAVHCTVLHNALQCTVRAPPQVRLSITPSADYTEGGRGPSPEHIVMHCTVLYCTVLYCTVPYCTVQFTFTVQFFTAVH